MIRETGGQARREWYQLREKKAINDPTRGDGRWDWGRFERYSMFPGNGEREAACCEESDSRSGSSVEAGAKKKKGGLDEGIGFLASASAKLGEETELRVGGSRWPEQHPGDAAKGEVPATGPKKIK